MPETSGSPIGAAPKPGSSEQRTAVAAPAPAAGPQDGPNGPRSGPPAAPAAAPWAETLSNLVIGTVERVKGQATDRVVILLRFIIYGLVILAGSVTALILLLIGAVRMWDVYVPLEPLGRRVWLGYIFFGGLFFLVGAWILSSGRKRAR